MTEDEPGVVAEAADITDLTRAEEIQLRYAAIVRSSDDAIIAKTLDGVISAWNAAAERMFGYTEHEAIGRPITMIIPPDLCDEEHDILRRLRAGERVEHYETVRLTKAGKRIDVSLTISPLRDPAGHGMTIDGHFENIPTALPQEISLRLYRVLQEALQNVVKHSVSRHAHVSLNGHINTISLTVKDSGAGFHPHEAMRGPGLGLTSMKERLKVIGGQLSIDSQRGRGTTIHAVAPLRVPTKPANVVR